MRQINSRTIATAAIAFGLCVNAFPLSNFTNYQSVIRISGIVAAGKTILAASSGGLLLIDKVKQTHVLVGDNGVFPDLNLTAIAQDSKGNIWLGSKQGYLYKRTAQGTFTSYNSYFSVGWGIQALYIYKDYVIVGSSQGLGIFDPVKGVSLHNATTIDSSSNASINAITVHNDSLYVGCQGSYDAFNISGDRFLNGPYLDATQWSPTYTASPIVCFVDSSGALMPKSRPALMAGEALYTCIDAADSLTYFTADSHTVNVAATSIQFRNETACTVPSAVTVMTQDEAGNIWIGTDQNYLYCWNRTSLPVQYKISGITDNYAGRVYTAKNGTLWVLPLATSDNPPWWTGIRSFDEKQWKIYNHFTVPLIGTFNGGGSFFNGICEDRTGNIWFGTCGSNVQMYDVHKNVWSQYYFAGFDWDSVHQLSLAEEKLAADKRIFIWGRHDAICQDSSGFLWVANFSNSTMIIKGCLICYNPNQTTSPNYRRFFSYTPLDEHYIQDIISLCVDSHGNIFVGGNDGRLLVLHHTGNPLANGVDVILDKTDLTPISEIVTTPSGVTWIATSNGLYKYSPDHASDIVSVSKMRGSFSSVAAESDSILWVGTKDKGLIRYNAVADSFTFIDNSNGLVSNVINDLSIDVTHGFLWIGTPDGISRYSLGHTAVPVADNASISAYPNPFSLSNPNHREIVFKNCAAGARINIYAVNGGLIKTLSTGKDNAYSGEGNGMESTLRWVPPKNSVPGAYYFVAQSQKPKPKKLLIIP